MYIVPSTIVQVFLHFYVYPNVFAKLFLLDYFVCILWCKKKSYLLFEFGLCAENMKSYT